MKKIIPLFLLVFLLLGCTALECKYTYLTMPDGTELKLKEAATNKEIQKGLSDVEQMDNYQGMFFILETPRQVGFWMKDMQFSLDIIYLDKNKQVLEIHANQQPCSNQAACPKLYSQTNNIKYVLEIPAGMAEHHGLTINAQLK